MFDDCIRTEGTVNHALKPGLFSVSLKNSKQVAAHLSKALASSNTVIPDGSRVALDMTPYDFDQARIEVILAETATGQK